MNDLIWFKESLKKRKESVKAAAGTLTFCLSGAASTIPQLSKRAVSSDFTFTAILSIALKISDSSKTQRHYFTFQLAFLISFPLPNFNASCHSCCGA